MDLICVPLFFCLRSAGLSQLAGAKNKRPATQSHFRLAFKVRRTIAPGCAANGVTPKAIRDWYTRLASNC